MSSQTGAPMSMDFFRSRTNRNSQGLRTLKFDKKQLQSKRNVDEFGKPLPSDNPYHHTNNPPKRSYKDQNTKTKNKIYFFL